jgi:hypothetical protein
MAKLKITLVKQAVILEGHGAPLIILHAGYNHSSNGAGGCRLKGPLSSILHLTACRWPREGPFLWPERR